ncbi:phosphate signaling complex PhoU family protein [Nocardia bovistercoris]|uniref:Phosphate transport system regulatory protein PhoU n=1 Tax=Nocardia bovistercoris TaxID=2785916 RepID=A0A931IC52_9NOCA|nr:PhoU domain-containing protein [Nocardia bovistercoris]MBH0777720.1 phosphate transport system regulatory protein PhoU [Nocardia bovistercoris]
MRTEYHEELAHLAELLHRMCVRDRAVIANATNTVITGDVEQAQNAIDIGGEVERMVAEAEGEALRLLALQAPVARELRQVVTGIQLTAALHRMGILGTHIATAARRRHPGLVVPEPVRPLVARMGAAAVAIATSAATVLVTPDPESAAMLDGQDDLMDRLHEELLTTVLDPGWGHGVTAAVDLTLVGRYYERFADNAVEVGRRTIFLATGETAERNSTDQRD